MEDSNLTKFPLHDMHVAMEASMGSEAGWAVPMSYAGPLAEATEVRDRAGVFDISHTGRIRIRGDQMLDLMELLCAHDVAHQEDDTAVRSLLLNVQGGVLADCHVVRLDDFWLILCDAGNRTKVLEHAQSAAEGLEAKVDDQTEKGAMFAVTGRAAADVLKAALPEDPSDYPPGGVKLGSLLFAKYIMMRTSYAGLWGLEVILPKMFAGKAWRFVTDKAGDNKVAPAGMGARDILRLEAGLCRYGYELNETIDPFTAGLGDLVTSSYDFIGHDAIEKLRGGKPSRKRVGLVLECEKPVATMIPTLGASVYREDGFEAGQVTSATYSPTLEKIIAMAYIATSDSALGGKVSVEVCGQSESIRAEIVELPFIPAVE